MEEEKAVTTSPKKSNKPQMEKKRRERINNSLNELKSLILGAMKKDASYYSKLEKADILEMAVDHVRNLQKQIRSGQNVDCDPMAKYRAGFVTCASEVGRLIMGFPDLDETVKFNVLKHLANCCTGDQRQSTGENPAKTENRSEALRTQERETATTVNKSTKLQSPLTPISQILDSRTVGEKRLLYQQLMNRPSVARTDFIQEMKKQHQYPIAGGQQTMDKEKMPDISNDVRSDDKIMFEPACNNNKRVMKQGFKAPQRRNQTVNTLIKPVPQLPEKLIISNGIRFMPATVLVPVQVGYSPVEFKQNQAADEKNEVWRPWEMEHLVKDSKTSGKTIFCL